MKFDFRHLNLVKQILLGLSILYFYGTALAMAFGLPLGELANPILFSIVGIVFFAAVLFEAAVTWWHRRRRVLWALVALSCYAVLGFIIAPAFYGQDILWIALLAPLVICFIGGFIYVYLHLFHRAFFSHMKLSADAILAALRSLPGWEYLNEGIEKTYRFGSYSGAVEFLNKALVAANAQHREPEFKLTRRAVHVRLTSEGSVTQSDLDFAAGLNSL